MAKGVAETKGFHDVEFKELSLVITMSVLNQNNTMLITSSRGLERLT